jgi:hypothetical protein
VSFSCVSSKLQIKYLVEVMSVASHPLLGIYPKGMKACVYKKDLYLWHLYLKLLSTKTVAIHQQSNYVSYWDTTGQQN